MSDLGSLGCWSCTSSFFSSEVGGNKRERRKSERVRGVEDGRETRRDSPSSFLLLPRPFILPTPPLVLSTLAFTLFIGISLSTLSLGSDPSGFLLGVGSSDGLSFSFVVRVVVGDRVGIASSRELWNA